MKYKTINNYYGCIKIKEDSLKKLIGSYVTQCYGIVDMSSKDFFRDGFIEILGHDNYQKGVSINVENGLLNIDLYVVLSFDVNISEVIYSIQNKIRYDIEKNLNICVGKVNVYVQDIEIS